MKVLLTGAAGFIGSALTRRLLAAGAAVTALCPSRATAAALPKSPGLRWIRADLGRPATMIADLHGQDAVIHLAGRFPLLGQPADAAALWQANTLDTQTLLQACHEVGLARVLLASSAHVYGVADPLSTRALREEDPLGGSTPYALSKIGAEQALRDWAGRSGRRQATCLRFFNVYGPGQSPANVVSAIGRQALASARVEVYCDWPQRDFVYVDDVVDALLAALQRPRPGMVEINIGSGVGTSIHELAHLTLRLAGHTEGRLEVREQVRPSASNPLCLMADIERASEWLDWTPATRLAQGLAATLGWMGAAPGPTPPP